MIKLNVEWHHKCSNCGTEMVADFFEDAKAIGVCLWCGRFDQSNYDVHCTELIKHIVQTTSGPQCHSG